MSIERQRKIDAARRAQPRAELERKAAKAAQRGIWTQEDFDLADAKADELYEAMLGPSAS